jgi:hypothetical protein
MFSMLVEFLIPSTLKVKYLLMALFMFSTISQHVMLATIQLLHFLYFIQSAFGGHQNSNRGWRHGPEYFLYGVAHDLSSGYGETDDTPDVGLE